MLVQATVTLHCLFLLSAPVASTQRSALLVVDVQKCFTPGGTLPVVDGDDVIPVINDVRRLFDLVVLSQDWHCSNHVSFASQHPEHDVLETVQLRYNESGSLCRTRDVHLPYSVNCSGETVVLNQMLWPDHCVMNTADADFHEELIVDKADIIIRKGQHCQLDSYSMFYDNGRFIETPLRQILADSQVNRVYLTGLAIDYCVYWSAKDAKEIGFETYVILDATRGIDAETAKNAIQDMLSKGIFIINSTDVEDTLTSKATGHSFCWKFVFFSLLNVCQIYFA